MEKYTLITGATSGIGFELAKLFAKDGDNLILVARNLESLNLAKDKIRAINNKIEIIVKDIDLADSESAKLLYQYTMDNGYHINKLLNNAGFGDHNAFLTSNYEKQIKMIELNVLTLVKLCYLYGNEMAKLGEGKILNVGSVASYLVGPYMANYYATKNYVLAFSLALAAELKKKNITVTVLCPGPTKTDFEKRAEMKSKTMFHTLHANEASYVAYKAYKALQKGKKVVNTGFVSKFGHISSCFFSRGAISKICGKINGHID